MASGVTTMGSDRADPGVPNPIGPNGGPQAQAVEQKQIAREACEKRKTHARKKQNIHLMV